MKFTGHERDLHISWNATAGDLDYIHARYRGVISGRFQSVDPVLGSPRAPQTWNRYVYSRNRPLVLVDPDGRNAIVSCSKTQCVVKVVAQIVVEKGNALQAYTAAAFKAGAERFWNSRSVTSPSGKLATFDVQMNIVENGKQASNMDTLKVVSGSGVAHVDYSILGTTFAPDTGTIFTEDATGNPSGMEGIGAHETGHLMGLFDLYDKILKVVPYSPGPEYDIMYGSQPDNSAGSAIFALNPFNTNVLIFGEP